MSKLKTLTNKFSIVLLIIGLILPLFIKNNYYMHIYFMCIMFAILASSLNIAVGMTGLSNLAHATFFGIGAYAAAIINTRYDIPFYLTLIAGCLVAMVFGIILGAPTLRLKGVFLALITTGFGQVMRVIEINWVSLTNGPMGLGGIGPAEIGGFTFRSIHYIYYGLAVLFLCIYISRRIMESKMGRALFSIKYDETVAKSLGVNVTFYKIGAYVLSAGLAGMAGTTYAHYISFISPDSFTMADSTTVLCMVILGGAGTLVGPVIGAIILTLIPELFRFANLYRIIFIGIVMVVGVIGRENNWFGQILTMLKNNFFNKKIENKETGGI